jgi:hypothetical protein
VKTVALKPVLQIWVCVNARGPDASLPSCGKDRGESLLQALQTGLQGVMAQQGFRIWINRSLCQGFCSAEGVSLVLEPMGLRLQAVTLQDVPVIVQKIKQAFGLQ